MKAMLCFLAVVAMANGGVLSGAGHVEGSLGGSQGGSLGGGALLGGSLDDSLGASYLSGGHDISGGSSHFTFGNDFGSSLGSNAGLFSAGSGPIFSGSHGHSAEHVVAAAPAVRTYNLNLPLGDRPELTYTSARTIQVLRPATVRVSARPVSVNVVKSVSVEEHPRPVQATLLVSKPTTVTVAKPVQLAQGHGGLNSGGVVYGNSAGLAGAGWSPVAHPAALQGW